MVDIEETTYGQYVIDTDGDGINDGIETNNPVSAIFVDANTDGYDDALNPSSSFKKDTDLDGIIDLLDTDDDNDGVYTSVELAMANGKIINTDGDGIHNYLDTDDDNDGVATLVEANLEYTTNLADTDQDRLVDMLDPDDDNDTITTRQELADQLAYNLSNDIDDDGKINYLDADDDGDGIATSIEKNTTNGNRLDANKNKLLDYLDKKGQSLYSLKLAETQNIYANQNGTKNYELTNHLGNVMAVVSNQKTTIFGTDGLLSYIPEVLQYNDYDPFGMLTPNRHGGEDYRYGFNGKEKDNEIKGDGNSLDYGARMYDVRVGRWFKPDALEKEYPSVSSYCYALNTPTNAKDPDGNVVLFFNGMHFGDGGRSEYWNGYDRKFMKAIGDYSARYYDGAMGGAKNTAGIALAGGFTGYAITGANPAGAVYGSAIAVAETSNVNRFVRIKAGKAMGFAQAKEIYENLSEGESVKIVTHSMGTAFSRGFVKGLLKWAKENGKEFNLEYQLDIAAFQGSLLPRLKAIKNSFFKSGKADDLANGTLGKLAGGSGSSNIPGARNISPKDPNVEHTINDYNTDYVKPLGHGNKNDVKGNYRTAHEESPQ